MFVKSFILCVSLWHLETDTAINTINPPVLPSGYCYQVTQKASKFSPKLNRQSLRAIDDLISKEQKMRDEVDKTDKIASDRIFSATLDFLRHVKQLLLNHKIIAATKRQFDGIDSLANTFEFLKSNPQLLKATDAIQDLGSDIKNAEAIKNILQSQRDLLGQQLSNFPAIGAQLYALNHQAYYYCQQIKEFKALIHDKKKAETKALKVLQNLPAYKTFMAQHSQLAMLLNLRSHQTLDPAAQGFQTRSAVDQVLTNRLAGANMQTIDSQMDEARQQVQTLKDKFPSLNSSGEMPDFKPKNMKTKSLRQCLEFGANTQFEKSSKFFPTTADIAGQVAYKFSKHGSFGIGASYKLGMGTYNHIHFTSQGVGLRSFLDWKVKQSLYVTGGFEENYNIPFASLSNLYGFNHWTGSALAASARRYS